MTTTKERICSGLAYIIQYNSLLLPIIKTGTPNSFWIGMQHCYIGSNYISYATFGMKSNTTFVDELSILIKYGQ